VWMCCVCEKCVDVCPQDGDPTQVFTNLKEMSYLQGLAPPSIYQLVSLLLNTACAYPINNAVNRNRTKLGLAELSVNPTNIQDLTTIAKECGLNPTNPKADQP
jgi:heterodisulfide reductase subunit C